jgi:hypothetical protein
MEDVRRRTLDQLMVDPDRTYRPSAALRRALQDEPADDRLDRPIIPLLNTLYAQSLRSKASCAGHARGDRQACAGAYVWLEYGRRASAFLFALATELNRPGWLSYGAVREMTRGHESASTRSLGLYWDYGTMRSGATLHRRDGELVVAARGLRRRRLRAARGDACAWRVIAQLEERFVFTPTRRETLLWSHVELNIDLPARTADVVVRLGVSGSAGERTHCVFRATAASLTALERAAAERS